MAIRTPYITNATGNVITQYSINAGVQAIIYVPADTGYGDLVEFHWGLRPLQKAFTPAEFPNYTWIVNIATEFPPQDALSDGTYEVSVNITDYLGNEASSTPFVITVTGSNISNPNFAAPVVQATINQAQWQAGFSVSIPASPSILAGDTYVVYVRANGIAKEYATGSVAAAGAITIPPVASSPALAGLDGVNGFFYYTISRGTPAAVVGTSAGKTVYIDVVPPGGS